MTILQVRTFKNTTNGFNFVFEERIAPKETVILKMPVVSPNKRGINDIGYAVESGVALYGTIASNPHSENAMWQTIEPSEDINKTVSFIKIVNTTDTGKLVNIRAILN